MMIVLSTVLISGVFIVPSAVVHAWVPGEPIVPCGGWIKGGGGADCNFDMLIQLADNLIDVFIWFSIPVAGVVFAYAGYLYITAAASEANIKKAHGLFARVALGIIVILVGYYIIALIVKSFLGPEYHFFE